MEMHGSAFSHIKIGFIGAGNMAQAIGIGLIKDGTIDPSKVIVSAPSIGNFPPWTALGVETTHENVEVVMKSDLIFLAVKPQILDQALSDIEKDICGKISGLSDIEKDICAKINGYKLFVSVLAGTTLDSLHKKLVLFAPDCRVVRAMPNTALTVRTGVVAIAANEKYANSTDVRLIENLLGTRGLCLTVPERMITPIGALAGSGIAYVYLMIEALSDGGVKMGIPRDKSTMLAAQTVLGGSKMILQTGKHPAQLKDEVCSAGGTTIEGIHKLECGSFRGTVMSAVEAAAKKSEQLEKA